MAAMIVAQHQEWLSQQDSNSPVCIIGVAKCGGSVQEWDINLGTGQGRSDDIDEVIISWIATPEAEARWATQEH